MSFHDLGTMIQYLVTQREKIAALVKEIDEINAGVTSEFVEAQDSVETAIGNAVSIADENYDDLDPETRKVFEDGMPAMHDIKGSRRVELEKGISELHADRAEIEDRDASELDDLATQNPALNEREEALKAQGAQLEAQIKDVEAQLIAAGAGMGWLMNVGKIGRLRKQHQGLATMLYGIRERLHEVRGSWVLRQTEAGDTQQQLQEAWRLRTAEIAKLTQEFDRLTDDFEGTCRRAVIEAHIRGNEDYAPTGVPALETALDDLTAWRQREVDCESGVVAVSEITGLLDGIGEGLKRMQESVEGVKKEQDMHAELSELKLTAPPELLQFNAIWDGLMQTVVDEKRSIEHPRAFADIVHDVVDTRLSNDQIEAMFNLAGGVLTEGTKQWD